MKGLFGRALELNCLFLVVVALLVALQLVLQRSHHKELLVQLRERGDEGVAGEEPQQTLPQLVLPDHPAKDSLQGDDAKAVGSGGGGGGSGGATVGDGVIAAPVVPNIRRSFPKRKAPYVRKAKKNKKKKKNRKSKQQQQQKQKKMELMRDGGGEGGVGGGSSKGEVGGGVKATPKAGRRGKGKGNDKTKVVR